MERLFAAPQQSHQSMVVAAKFDETPTQLTELVAVLEDASHTAKRFTSAGTANARPSEIQAAFATIRKAHQVIGSFLARSESQEPLMEAEDGDERMSDLGEDEERDEVENGFNIVADVEEGVREFVLQSKRRKRLVSPSSAAGPVADRCEELPPVIVSVNSVDRRCTALDLVYQFHA